MPRASALRKRAAVAAVAVALSTVTACGGGSSASASGGPLALWTITQPSSAQGVVEGLIKSFNSQYPGGGHITINWIGGEPYKQKIAVAMAGHQPPAMFLSYGGQLLQQWAKGGDVADISAELNADPKWKAQYAAKNVFQLASAGDKIYGVPESGPDFELMWQNKAVLSKAGATASPATFPEFLTAIEKVKQSGKEGVALAGKDLWPEMIWLQYLVLRIGGPQVFEKIAALTPGAWSDPAVLKAATTVNHMAKSGAFAKGFNTISFDSGQADHQLASGQAAFQAQLYYDSANMRVFDPKFAASSDYSPFTFPAFPGGAGDPKQLVGQAAEYYGVSSRLSAEDRKQVLAFLKYLTTSDDYNIKNLAERGYSPITPSAASELSSGKIQGGALLKKLYDIGTSAPSFQPYWDQDLPSAVISPMLTAIGELFDQTITPQQFVDQMNKVLVSNQPGK